MDADRASRTAEHVALFRALESRRRGDRLFDDPYAAAFLTGQYRLVARLAAVAPLGRRLERYIDGRWNGGPRASAVVRTRLIDDLVTEALAGTAGDPDRSCQLLLLGAGYDSRAYRLPAASTTTVFEVDHPATQAAKRRLLRGRLPAGRMSHVHFVPVDLLHDDLGAALRRAGFASAQRTVVIWEGVTNYLTAEAVDATLRLLAGTTGPGSRIIFTYVDRAALDGTGRFAGFERWRDSVRDAGEPWTFGFHPDELPGYLTHRGLVLMSDLSTREAAVRYLAPLGRDEPTAEFYRVAEAEVR
ncbi:class I SAM-dependent methyltransferase [Rugosimonospora acidiphila]|uniref:S-adenosyl-L-methionine-dependent methyltransferase n=1 Tax=Rugosimonospora acidiphila TaxID=556531 RepID=A0ABP9SMA5_9ACTN